METSITRDVLAAFGAGLSDPVRTEVLMALGFGPSKPASLHDASAPDCDRTTCPSQLHSRPRTPRQRAKEAIRSLSRTLLSDSCPTFG